MGHLNINSRRNKFKSIKSNFDIFLVFGNKVRWILSKQSILYNWL